MTPSIEDAIASLLKRAAVEGDSTSPADVRKVVAVIHRDGQGGERGEPERCHLALWLRSATSEARADAIRVTESKVLLFSGEGTSRAHRTIPLPLVVAAAVKVMDKLPKVTGCVSAAVAVRRAKYTKERKRRVA